MSFLKSSRRQHKLGEVAYVIINALLPPALFLLTIGFNSPYPALLLVLLSKWRILALRPHFWWMSIKANAVDIMFGLSMVILLYMLHQPTQELGAQMAVVLAYEGWLLFLKPRSDTWSVLAQAGLAQFLALTVLFALSTSLNDFVVILGCWAIGYSAARHVLGLYSEEMVDLFSTIWALLIAQLGWLLWHWTIAYNVGLAIKVPQMALLALVLSFVASRLYIASKTNKLGDLGVRLSVALSAILATLILLLGPWSGTI